MSGSDHDWGGPSTSTADPTTAALAPPCLVLEDDDDGLKEGDLGGGPACAKFLRQLTKEEYYNSSRFAIGYSELQARWCGEPWQGEMASPSSSTHSSPSIRERKQSLALMLSGPSQENFLAPGSRRFSHRWSSSVGASPLGTPSPLLSEPPSPIPSHSPSSGSSVECVARSGCCRGSNGSIETESALPPGSSGSSSSRKRRNGLLDSLKRMFGFRTGRGGAAPRRSSSEQQVSVLEAELESYRQLSDAKRQAADLLKHQLMEVLYEKVVTEVEEKHKRRHLEEEIMKLEFQLHLLRATTEDNIRSLSTQLQRESSPQASAVSPSSIT